MATFSSKITCKKDEEKEPKPKRMRKILMSSIRQKTPIRRVNPKGKLKGAQTEHL
jgi:phosphotransferase system HPr-like phosphotransfer protein